MLIRLYADSDYQSVVAMMAALQEAERALHASRMPGSSIAAAHFDYLKQLTQEQQGAVLVALLAEQIMGFLVCAVETLDDGDQHLRPELRRFGVVTDLYVKPEARGQGIARALMHNAEAHLRQQGVGSMRINVLSGNSAAGFYRVLGYENFELTLLKRI